MVRSILACWHCSTEMRVRSLKPFGAEIEGLTVGAAASDVADELRTTIAHHRVVVLRDGDAGDMTLVDFLTALGPLTFTHGETPVVGAQMLNCVSNIGRSVPPRSVFHTDTSYAAAPPAFTALRAEMLPSTDGATLFSDQVAAAARLPLRVRDWLAGRSVAHRATGVPDAALPVRHSLFRRHPLTGEVTLYLSTPERCTDLSGVDAATSARVIAALYRHSIRPSRLYAHRWRRGDVVIWDNRVTMHRADHDGVVGDRVLHRGLVAGETPLPA